MLAYQVPTFGAVRAWGDKSYARSEQLQVLQPSERSWALVWARSPWHFPYLERAQGVLDGVRRGPVGPPGLLELAALVRTPRTAANGVAICERWGSNTRRRARCPPPSPSQPNSSAAAALVSGAAAALGLETPPRGFASVPELEAHLLADPANTACASLRPPDPLIVRVASPITARMVARWNKGGRHR